MRKSFILVGMVVAFLLFSCSSSKNPNDTDILPDSDINTQDSETQDDDSDMQETEFVDDSEETLEQDSNSDTEEDFDYEDDETENDEEYAADFDLTNCCEDYHKEFPDEPLFDEPPSIFDRYKRCYDEIPDDPYEGLFASSKLESQIKQSLGYEVDYELTEEDLEKVKEITLSVKDIRGIEKLINLESVTISTGKIYDYTPLSKLKKLKDLVIDASSMTCLDASFSLLTSLETLEIEDTQLKDVSPIEQLVNLKSLELSCNQIESLPENIGNLQKLEWLAFDYNNIENLEPIQTLTNLRELFFNYNYIKDISPIRNLVNLTRLGGNNNRIIDISPLTNLVNLTYYVGLTYNQIEELPKGITNLKKLQTIELGFNNISSLPDLKGLDALKQLGLSHNKLENKDLLKLNDLTKLEFLYVAVNKKITKVPIMKNLKSLYELILTGNNINDLSGFADNESFPALKRLDVGSNKIDNVEAFRNRKGLSSLWVDKNCIKDFSPLEELKERGTYVGGMNEQLESCEDK
ncbi:hypothetical protein J6Y50_03200 [bacterium]|nr:hypothetical protein [bacterium]